jgi:hypothetical protein
VRRDAFVSVRESVPLREKKRRVDDVRFGGAKSEGGGERGGDIGPRRELRRW